MSEVDTNRKIAVILVADVVGYSKHMERDENATLQSYSECEIILNELLHKRQGSIFNTAGDSVLAEFTSAVNAVEFAVEFQNKIIERNKSDDIPAKLEFRRRHGGSCACDCTDQEAEPSYGAWHAAP